MVMVERYGFDDDGITWGPNTGGAFVSVHDYDALAARLAEEVENAATYKQERDEICVNYETVAAKLSEAHRQNADLMAIIDKRDEALGFIPLDKGMDMQDELREVKARLAEAERRLARIRGIAAEPRPLNLAVRMENIVAIIDAPDGFSGLTDSASPAPDPTCAKCGATVKVLSVESSGWINMEPHQCSAKSTG